MAQNAELAIYGRNVWIEEKFVEATVLIGGGKIVAMIPGRH